MMYDIFTVYECEHELIRMGCNYDGGYVVADCGGYDRLISCGIGHNASFEMDFRARYPDAPIRMYDPCISTFPKRGESLLESDSEWRRLWVSDQNQDGYTDLRSELLAGNDILLKMDIERSEVPWIMHTPSKHLHRIKQAVIEFHNIKPPSLESIKKLLSTHVLIHVHGNNYATEKVDGDFRITRAYELTLLRKKDVGKLRRYKGILPIHKLDFPNNRAKPDYDLCRLPFTAYRESPDPIMRGAKTH